MRREKKIIISVFSSRQTEDEAKSCPKTNAHGVFVTVYLHQYVKQIQGSDRAAPECGGRNRANGS